MRSIFFFVVAGAYMVVGYLAQASHIAQVNFDLGRGGADDMIASSIGAPVRWVQGLGFLVLACLLWAVLVLVDSDAPVWVGSLVLSLVLASLGALVWFLGSPARNGEVAGLLAAFVGWHVVEVIRYRRAPGEREG